MSPHAPRVSIVIPTIGRRQTLQRVLGRLAEQTADPGDFEVVVAVDANEDDPDAIAAEAANRPYETRTLHAARPGASAARNLGVAAARAKLVLFLDDDILPLPELIAGHLAWHLRFPDQGTAVLGHVRWSGEIEVTPFMRWVNDALQFDYGRIEGIEAGWGRFYTANASVKRALLLRAGGFDEERLPFGYEDLDLAYRLRDQGFRLVYNRSAVGEHLHPMSLDFWRQRVRRIAVAEREFTRLHPDVPPYFHRLFEAASGRRPVRGRGAALARLIPPWVPVLGPRAWASLDAVYTQALAPDFLAAWGAAEVSPGPTAPDLSERRLAAAPDERDPGHSSPEAPATGARRGK